MGGECAGSSTRHFQASLRTIENDQPTAKFDQEPSQEPRTDDLDAVATLERYFSLKGSSGALQINGVDVLEAWKEVKRRLEG